MGRIISIARNTFTEVIRQPIFFILLMLASIMIALGPAFSFFTMMQGDKLLKDTGLATMLLTCLLLGAFSASGVVSREIQNKTAATVLSKPAGKVSFIVGKFFGIAGTIGTAMYIMSIIYMITLRYGVKLAAYEDPDHPVIVFLILAFFLTVLFGVISNYFFGRNFCSSAVTSALPVFTFAFIILCFISPKWSLQAFAEKIQWRLLLGSLLTTFAALVLTALAVALSTRLQLVPALTISFLFFIVGLMSDYLFLKMSSSNIFVRAVYAVVPNLQYFWIADALVADKPVPAGYVFAVLLYMTAMITAILAFGAYLFEEKELA
jgi:ABC-2 type transport system permease protein